jgi:hypothetical protein
MNTRKNHVLLKYASTYERFKGSLAPEGCHYDQRVGAWLVSETGELFVGTTDRLGPRTKKEDIETGEDQKGE